MLPRSCRRLCDSKSNSSRRLPLVTTIRVSSGWMPSTSILLVAIKRYSAPSRAEPPDPKNRAPWDRAMRGEWFLREGARGAGGFSGADAAEGNTEGPDRGAKNDKCERACSDRL